MSEALLPFYAGRFAYDVRLFLSMRAVICLLICMNQVDWCTGFISWERAVNLAENADGSAVIPAMGIF